MTKVDPSEAADSDRVLDAMGRYLPDAFLTTTGGVVYHLVLTFIPSNLGDGNPTNRALLGMLLVIDELNAGRPGIDNYYATILASKTPGRPRSRRPLI